MRETGHDTAGGEHSCPSSRSSRAARGERTDEAVRRMPHAACAPSRQATPRPGRTRGA